MSTYEIHTPMWRNSYAKPCLTYGLVGYGYVSVQARRRAPYFMGEHGKYSEPDDEHDLRAE